MSVSHGDTVGHRDKLSKYGEGVEQGSCISDTVVCNRSFVHKA